MNSKEYRKCLFLRLIGVVTLLLFILCPSINAQKNPKQVFKIAESAVKSTKVQNLKKMPKASSNLRPGAVQGNLYHDFSKRTPASASKLHPPHSVTRKVNTRLNAQKPNKASPADNANVKKKEIEYKFEKEDTKVFQYHIDDCEFIIDWFTYLFIIDNNKELRYEDAA